MICDIVGIDVETGNAIIKIRADRDKYTAAVLVQHNKIPQEFHGPRRLAEYTADGAPIGKNQMAA